MPNPYAYYDPLKDPFVASQPKIYPNQLTGTSGDLFKSGLAGMLGAPADILQMMADIRAREVPFSPVKPLDIPLTSEKLQKILGANPETDASKAGLIGAPDIRDVLRAGGRSLLAMTLFHGSPAKFDRFSLDFLGTGEGAQAFGHGLYFAESPGVGRSYQVALSPGRGSGPDDIAARIVNDLENTGKTRKEAKRLAIEEIESRKQRARNFVTGSDPDFMRRMDDAIESIKSDRFGGHIYEVEIPDEVTNKMLDWHKPLSEQPDIRRKLQILIDSDDSPLTGEYRKLLGEAMQSFELNNTTGETIIRLLGSDETGSQILKEIGIPGIRYRAGSLSGGSGKTDNIVLFDPNDIRQVKRDGEMVFNHP